MNGMIVRQILNMGTSQGCVFSLILFSVYINELTNNTTLKLVKHADDMDLMGCLRDEQSPSQ